MKKTFVPAVAAVALAAATLTSATAPAYAGHRGRFAAGLATGIIGLGLLGAYAHARRGYPDYYYHSGGGCYPGPERCGWTRRHCFYDDWGDYVCRGGRYRCWRPTYCD